MKIYNEEKTQELINPDLERGYLRNDRLLIKHTDAIPEKVIKTVEEVKDELEAAGKQVKWYESVKKWYLVTAFYPKTGKMKEDGYTVEEIKPVIEPAVPAHDDYEDIQVYHAYTEEEYKDYLRRQRAAICFPVINRGAAWYSRLTPEQNEELQAWYQAWLDAPETGIKPETPNWV